MDRRRTRRGLVALAGSLALHLCLLAAMLRPEPPPVVPARPPPTPVKLIWLEAPEVPTKEEPAPVPVPRSVRAKSRTLPSASAQAPLDSARGERGAPLAGADRPTADVLTPSGFPLVGASEAARGHTLHPGDLPSAAEQLADEQERVSGRVGGWLAGDLGAARVRGGLPDPAYGQLGAELRAATDQVPKFIDTDSPKEVVGALMESWGAGAERYGKTGAPYAEPEGRLENVERPSALADAVARGSPDAQATASFLAAGARLQEFADGRAGLELYALVELRQQPSGALDSVTLVRPSGLAPFDAWVTERARHVGLAFSLDGGSRMKALRSVWRFDGIILYRRKLKLSELDGRAALGLISMTALSALSGGRMPGALGRFDEVTGALDVVDLSNPTYDCKVRLIEAD